MQTPSLFDQISSAEDRPAKTSPWLDDVLALLESAAGSSSSSRGSSMTSLPSGFSSRTSLVCSAAIEGSTLPPSLRLLLDRAIACQTEGGKVGESRPGHSTELHGAYVTLSGGESHSAAVVCSLSDVLETRAVPQKYYLSPTACRGILRRAAKRGRQLPRALHQALAERAGTVAESN